MNVAGEAVVVVDVEATCWRGRPPEGEQQEIIEIGVCLLDIETGIPHKKDRILVKPTRSTVSRYCTRLTGLTQEQVEAGISFAGACQLLADIYQTASRAWASWGNFDREIFAAQCLLLDVAYPFSQHHINVKPLFSACQGLPEPVGLKRALKVLRWKFEGRLHSGQDDAWNIARILGYLISGHGRAILLE
ncbi:MAG: exonuclease domain-containing protein [Chloroflexota bacterium]